MKMKRGRSRSRTTRPQSVPNSSHLPWQEFEADEEPRYEESEDEKNEEELESVHVASRYVMYQIHYLCK